ncbi:MAG: DUF5320 domain-containing protein [Desulfurococcaceae archaeon]
MAWWYWSPYPGHGPWRHLPPPLRPGWYLWGRWWYGWQYVYPRTYPPSPFASAEDELRYLEELKKYLNDFVLKEIDRRIAELRGTQK